MYALYKVFFDIKWAGYKRSVFPCAQVRTLLFPQTAIQKQQQQNMVHGMAHSNLNGVIYQKIYSYQNNSY